MLELPALLRAAGVPLSAEDGAVKVHLAVDNGIDNPIDVFHEGDFPSWQQEQTAKNFECDQVIALISLGDKRWLFAGVYTSRSRKNHPTKRGRFIYDLKELSGQKELIGRIVVRWDRKGARSSYRWLESMGVVASPFHALCDRLAGAAPSGVKVPQPALLHALKEAGWVDCGRLKSREFDSKKHIFCAPEMRDVSKSELRRLVEDIPPPLSVRLVK